MITKYVQRFARNAVGRDFVVGDIHGCFAALEIELAAIRFDECIDRLFSVGDLVDRGPQSSAVIDWINKPWFHAVQGNHEDMAIRYVEPGNRDRDHYMMNGGAWLIGMQRHQQVEYADAMATLPYAIEVETDGGLVGIVHADIHGKTWADMVQAFACVDSNNKLKRVTNDVLWNRDRIQSEDHSGVPDMRAVVVGHTPLRRPAALGNVYHIDTGGWLRGGSFTFLNLETLESTPPRTRSLEWEAA
ncbi:metallophosphoesterase [Paraburkholderia diazotrophica]|uniref:Serine/threonine protein phosphatase 1 n=1 Tax=Paraburkholderia diazotrophica TaxID=667676 RepID=A0A1H6QM80_9BURK|nr:metallophosphoesterase [Paraburkholderia diazotrophica]SEI42134.1 serine/threonine protein phosphatase 1 [Paraburkholderia diazotrophica]